MVAAVDFVVVVVVCFKVLDVVDIVYDATVFLRATFFNNNVRL